MTVEELQWHKSENNAVWKSIQLRRECLHLKWELRGLLRPMLDVIAALLRRER